jgi:hypothetical protein
MDDHGLAGYGVYWRLVEYLRAEKNYEGDIMMVNRFAKSTGTSVEMWNAILGNYKLFVINGKHFYSKSLKERMKIIDRRKDIAKQNALKRWKNPEKKKAIKRLPPLEENEDYIPEYNEVEKFIIETLREKQYPAEKARIIYDHYDKVSWKRGITPLKWRVVVRSAILDWDWADRVKKWSGSSNGKATYQNLGDYDNTK